ncbi:MAG: hypothetical protein ACTHPS_23350 [Streptosporangiaceae bacterium]
MGIDSGRQENWFGYDVPVDDYDILGDASPEEFWGNYWASDSCCYPDRTGDLRSVTKISDFYSTRQWHSTGMYRDTVRLAGVEHQLALCLPAGPGRLAGPGQTVRLLFSRGPGLDFSERDRAVLTLLRPHLHRAYIDVERRRNATPQLTPGNGNCCAWLPPGIPTPRSPGSSAYRKERCASTCRTSTRGCRCRTERPRSAARFQTSRPRNG